MFVFAPVASAATVSGYFEPGGYYGGYSGYHEWVDYCPLCGHSYCLLVNPKGTHEGEITCGYCDADYDGCTGYDKYGGGARARLTRYYEPEPEPPVEVVPPAEPKSVTVQGLELQLTPTQFNHYSKLTNEVNAVVAVT